MQEVTNMKAMLRSEIGNKEDIDRFTTPIVDGAILLIGEGNAPALSGNSTEHKVIAVDRKYVYYD